MAKSLEAFTLRSIFKRLCVTSLGDNQMLKEQVTFCTYCSERVAEYDVDGGIRLCKRCYEEMHFNIFQQMEEFTLF